MSYFMSLHYWLLSEVHFASGNLKNAQSCIEEALKLSQKNKEKHMEGMSLEIMGRILGKADISNGIQAEGYVRTSNNFLLT